jgi:cytochrome c-type biogenesis protein CcmH/NrfG
LGCLYVRNNQKDEGVKHLVEAHRLDPEDIDTMMKLGEIYARDESKIDQAQAILEQALEQEYNLSEAHVLLGRIYEKKGRQDDAME